MYSTPPFLSRHDDDDDNDEGETKRKDTFRPAI